MASADGENYWRINRAVVEFFYISHALEIYFVPVGRMRGVNDYFRGDKRRDIGERVYFHLDPLVATLARARALLNRLIIERGGINGILSNLRARGAAAPLTPVSHVEIIILEAHRASRIISIERYRKVVRFSLCSSFNGFCRCPSLTCLPGSKRVVAKFVRINCAAP